jgi:hypothetical protein
LLKILLCIGAINPTVMEKIGEPSLDVEAVSFSFEKSAEIVSRKKPGVVQMLKDIPVKFSRIFYFSFWGP